MPSTPQMRKANEKNAKNVTKRGQVGQGVTMMMIWMSMSFLMVMNHDG